MNPGFPPSFLCAGVLFLPVPERTLFFELPQSRPPPSVRLIFYCVLVYSASLANNEYSLSDLSPDSNAEILHRGVGSDNTV